MRVTHTHIARPIIFNQGYLINIIQYSLIKLLQNISNSVSHYIKRRKELAFSINTLFYFKCPVLARSQLRAEKLTTDSHSVITTTDKIFNS